jgi:hypothetical protein
MNYYTFPPYKDTERQRELQDFFKGSNKRNKKY